MSGPLLLGIVAVGAGWAWMTRGPVTTPAVADTKTANADLTTDPTVGDGVMQAQTGIDAVKAAVDGSSPASTIGDVPVIGDDGGTVIPVVLNSPEGGLVIPSGKSTGGADPSVQRTATHTGGDGPIGSPPAIQQGDNKDTILQTLYGPGGSDGLTNQQISNAIRTSAVWSNEVF